MGLDALRVSSSGLLAAQKAMEITSNNIANAGNDKYTRQRVNLASVEQPNGSAGGVRVLGVTRMRDTFADTTWRAETATANAYQSRADALARVENSLGTATDGLSSILDEFFAAWHQLSMSPTDTAAREGVIASARTLASDFNRIDQGITNQISDTLSFADDTATEANSVMKDISRLNSAIAQAEQSGVSHSELLDARDAAIDTLASLVGARVSFTTNNDGQLDVLVGGFVVVRGDYHAAFEVRGNGSAASPLGLGVVGTPEAERLDVTGGKLGGMFTSVNEDLAGVRARLDSVAMAVKATFNTGQAGGFDLNGNPGSDMFSGTTAGTLSVSSGFVAADVAASASGAPGDGNNALAVAELSTDQSPTGAVMSVRTFIVTLGAEVAAAERVAAISDDVLAGTTRARQEAMGVNIDEEMVDLIRYQRAFQASAQAVSVANEVLDTLINRMMR